MAGVDQNHGMARGFEDGGHQGHKSVRDPRMDHQGVEPGDGGREVGLRQYAELRVGAKSGHEKGRHHPLAGHVSQQDGHALSR